MISYAISMKAIASLICLASIVNGHMIMKTPIPYGRGSISNSPLDASGSDFPCKNIFTMTDPVNDVNHMAIGEPQTLSFTGSAVHGGGSCQVSLTTDLQPNKGSKWMVIKSIEGGCPADVSGNLPTDPSGSGASTFQYTVPAGITPGQYTIAWTWVNKIGNREFYMNCGRADITAAKKKRYAPTPKPGFTKRDASFPGLFVANIAGVSSGCTTTEGTDILYPNPGADVQKSSDGHFGPPVGCTGSAADTPAQSPSASAAGSAASSATAGSGGVPGVFASGAVPQSSAAATASASVVTASASASSAAATVAATSKPAAASVSTAVVSPTPVASASASPAASSGTPSAGYTAGTACTDEGDWFCAPNGLSFQRCASGQWSVAMSVAAGTKCTPGLSSSIIIGHASNKKRSALALHKMNLHHRRSSPVHT